MDTDVDASIEAIQSGNIFSPEIETIVHVPNILSQFQSISDPLEDWINGFRANLLERAGNALAEIYKDSDIEPKKRLRAAQIAFQLNSFDEAAARAIMMCNAELNQTSTAIRFYDELYENFEQELDIAPSLATQDMAAQIKLNLEAAETVPKRATFALVSSDLDALPGKTPRDVSVAVVPFERLGPVETPGYVTLGLLDEITCALAGLVLPAPISSNTMRRYLDSPSPRPGKVREDVGSRYVVTGSIRSNGDQAAVTVQMADAVTEQVLWADVHRCAHTAVLDIHPAIVSRIVNSVAPSLHGAELARTRSVDASELEPFHLVLRARELIFMLSMQSFREAGQLLETAIKKGPSFAPAHAASADWYSIRIWQGWSRDPQQDQEKLEQHARAAINLVPSDGRALALLGHNRLIFSYRYDEAQSHFDQALSLMPGDSETLSWTVPGLAYCGRTGEAIVNGERAISLSPFDPFHFRNQHFLSIAHYTAGNYDTAADLGLSSFQDNSTYVSNLRFTIASLFASGRQRKAQFLVAHHHKIEPNFRVKQFIARHPFRNDQLREQYGRHLVEAGLHS